MGALRQVLEHVGDRSAQPGLLPGDLDGDFLDRVERPRDPADLVLGRGVEGPCLPNCRHVGLDGRRELLHAFHGLGKLAPGDVLGGVLERAQRVDERAGDE